MADPKVRAQQLKKMSGSPGFIAALDQSGGSTPGALKVYGVTESDYSGEAEMMDKVHEMRSRMMTCSAFTGKRVLGAILFEATMDREVGGKPTAQYLWEEKKVIPFLKCDKGLAELKDGVQMMKDNPKLEELLDRGNEKGIFGTKMRSLIKENNPAGIKAIVEQQFSEGKRIIAKGMIPILEPEVDIKSPDKEAIETLLASELLAGLGKLDAKEKVMFKLTIPTKPNIYKALADHANTVRLVALSGGYSRDDSCKMLAANAKMIASFSRAFAEGLNAKQTDEEFTKTMDGSIQVIFEASKNNPVPLKKPKFVKVSSLQPDSDGLNLYLKVISKGEEVKGEGGDIAITEATVGDDSGCAVIRLRGAEQTVLGATPGNSIVIQNGRLKMFRGHIRIEVDKWGKIRKAEGDHAFTVLESKNVSDTEYELVGGK